MFRSLTIEGVKPFEARHGLSKVSRLLILFFRTDSSQVWRTVTGTVTPKAGFTQATQVKAMNGALHPAPPNQEDRLKTYGYVSWLSCRGVRFGMLGCRVCS